MREASYYPRLAKYYEKNATNSMAVEVKITKTNVLPFKCLMDHQEEYQIRSERKFAWKIDDTGRRKKPFDIFVLYQADPVLIAIYYKPKGTEIYEIPLRKFLEEKYASGNKSLSKERASQIGSRLPL